MGDFNERDIDNIAAIMDHCEKIQKLIDRFGKDIQLFKDDFAYRDAVLMNVFQIGEITKRLSDDCKENLTGIPWDQIYATRNIIAHGYVKVDDEIIWNTVVNDVQSMRIQLENEVGYLL